MRVKIPASFQYQVQIDSQAHLLCLAENLRVLTRIDDESPTTIHSTGVPDSDKVMVRLPDVSNLLAHDGATFSIGLALRDSLFRWLLLS